MRRFKYTWEQKRCGSKTVRKFNRINHDGEYDRVGRIVEFDH